MGIPIASELLEIVTVPYLEPFLTWGCIGARTCTSQPHRQLVSGLSFPTGFKNSTEGNIDHALNGILCAATPHVFLGMNEQGHLDRIETFGNPDCSLVLRGSIHRPNFDPLSVQKAFQRSREFDVSTRLIIDCSHDNCQKQEHKQLEVFDQCVRQIQEGSSFIGGLMLESHLYSGHQQISPQPRYGISVTDPCLSWQQTEDVVLSAYEKLRLITI